MFCKNCGAQNGNVPFCANCGSPLSAEPAATNAPYTAPAAPYAPPAAPAYGAPAAPYAAAPADPYGAPAYGAPAAPAAPGGGVMDKVKKAGSRIPLPAIIGVVVAVVVVLLIILFSSGSAKSVAMRYIKLESKGNFAKAEKLLHKEVIKEEKLDKTNHQNDLDDLTDDFNEAKDDFEDEEGKVKFSYRVKDVDDLKKQNPDSFDALEEYYEEEYDLKVKAAKVVEIEVQAKCEDRITDHDCYVTLVKIGGSWKVAETGHYDFDDFAPYVG